MKWKFPKFTMVRLFLFIIIGPTALVFITIATMHSDAREYKVTHEVYFDIESDGEPLGTMVFGLFGETVPRTVKNFITFSSKGYSGYKYEGTRFHRVIKKFMIQGGDVVSGDGKGSISIYGPSFPDENFDVKHAKPGFLSMANKGKDTNGCQFFITTIATPWLNDHHVVFGKVIEGLEIVHVIEHMATDWDDKPVKDITIVKSGRRTVKESYTVTDDPYNLWSWLKTISFPLGLSFAIIYLFSHFIGKLDEHIMEDDGAVSLEPDEEIYRKNKEKRMLEEKKSLLENQGAEKKGKGQKEKEKKGEGQKEKEKKGEGQKAKEKKGEGQKEKEKKGEGQKEKEKQELEKKVAKDGDSEVRKRVVPSSDKKDE